MINKNQDSELVKKINSTNSSGIFLSRKNGKTLAEKHPEILERWKAGETLTQLAQDYVSNFEISKNVGINSIYYCLRYLAEKGMISLEELQKIPSPWRARPTRLAPPCGP